MKLYKVLCILSIDLFNTVVIVLIMSNTINELENTVDEIYDSIPPLSFHDEYNNYITRNPFSDSNEFTCDLSLDFVRLFIPSEQFNNKNINTFLTSLNISWYFVNKGEGLFYFTVNGIEFRIHFFKCHKDNYYIGLLIKVFQPNRAILDYLVTLLNGNYIISMVEFTVDLRAEDLNSLFGIIKNTMCMKWPGEPFSHNYNTLYMNNLRKVRSTGARAYIKKINEEHVARIEVVAKRPRLNKEKINTLAQLYSLTGDHIYKRLAFRQIKELTVRRKWAKRAQIEHPGEVGGIKKSELAGLFFAAQVDGALASGVADMGRVFRTLLTKGEYMQEHPFHKFFFDKVAGKKFIL